MERNPKIKELDELAVILAGRGDKKAVLCHGVFDLLHIGHIRHFQQARQAGDILVVTLTPDTFVDKGPQRPAFPQDLRLEGIASLDCVDYVALNPWPTADNLLRKLKPDFYAKGAEFKNAGADRVGKIAGELAVLDEIGASMIFTEDIVFSSSNLINRYFSNQSREHQEYMGLFRQRHSLEGIQKVLDDMAGLKVLVLGDTILDEYQYGDVVGKSSKDPVLAMRYKSQDLFAGGVLAVANHVAGFAGQVDMVTVLGETDSREDFIRQRLAPGVRPTFYYQKGAPTIIKRRYIDGYSLNKLLEIYVMDDRGLPPEDDARMIADVRARLKDYDLILVADYGHGAISRNMADMLSEEAPFLAINTQANAGNRGFHTVSRYKRSHFVSLAEHEMRLEFRNSNGIMRGQIDELARRMQSQVFIVTSGRRGCTVWNESGEFTKVPAFAEQVVDRVGAGDAFLSVTALAARLNAPDEILGFLGNATGALAVKVVGNAKPIDKKSVEKFVTALMK